jgi:MFS family permease
VSLLTRPDAAMPGQRDRHRRLALAIVCLAALIINVDNTILNVALPTLVRDLHATSSQLQWIVDSYAMVFAGLLLVGGTLADRFGRKRFFLIGLTVFALGSIGAALSSSVTTLIAFRALMGAGAALTIPTSLAIINDIFRDPGERARAIGVWAARSGSGSPSVPSPVGSCCRGSGGGRSSSSTSRSRASASSGPRWWSPTRRTRTCSAPIPSGPRCRSPASDCCSGRSSRARPGGGPRGPWWGRGWPVSSCSVASSSGSPAARIPCSSSSSSAIAGSRSPSPQSAWRCSGSWGRCSSRPSSSSSTSGSPLSRRDPDPPDRRHGGRRGRGVPVAARLVGIKVTVAAGLVSIAAGLWQVSASSRFDTTYGDVVLGLLLIGFGAGLMLPTATNSVIGSVPQGDSGMGSASNTVALQVGGALGVAVIGSVMLTRYQATWRRRWSAGTCLIGRTDHLRVPGRCPGGGGTRRRLDRGSSWPAPRAPPS